MTISLDTSGEVWTGNLCPPPNHLAAFEWTDLSPFTQGYVEALFASQDPPGHFTPLWADGTPCDVAHECGFRDLAHEALAAILRDVDRQIIHYNQPNHARTCSHLGREFWRDRQNAGLCFRNHDNTPAFPVLTPRLDPDGKVRGCGEAP